MDLLASTGTREGNRGGRDQFSWEKVKEDKYRENYLGHSLHAPVGLSSKKKDPQWFVKPPLRQNSGNEELKKIQQQEAIMLRASLQGIPVQDAIALALEQTSKEKENNAEVVEEKSEEPLSSQTKPSNDVKEDDYKQRSSREHKSHRHRSHYHRKLKSHSKRRHRHSLDRKRRHHHS